MSELRCLGCFVLKQRWGLTGRGWFLAACTTLVIFVYGLVTIQPFLAMNRSVNTNILVVEGWLPDDALAQAVQKFHSHGYLMLLTTGGPVRAGSYLVKYGTYAQLAASTLIRLGIDAKSVVAVAAPKVLRDRTYASALALKKWLKQKDMHVRALNVLTLGAHARRTHLLFQDALGPNVKVGIIAVQDSAYDANKWWISSEGFRTVIGESIAYIYARFLFTSFLRQNDSL